ncbi:MAG: nucleotide exchange factor GrpE [Candidatus Caldarchaeum sp.]|uniref:Nucleotide exchange factor GrpE n=1 Tax=Caldiarchaeum subterraneum TaxID=311458 RepID=A0A7C5QML1_CALS0
MSEDVIKALEAEKKELMDSLMYARAELLNLRRLMEQETKRAESFAVERLARKLLTFYEDFGRVVNGLKQGEVPETLHEALNMLLREMEKILQSEGVEKMDVQGKEFNPFEHEAVEFFEAEDVTVDTVADVISPGYRLRDKVLKPPKVKVARPKKRENGKT